MGHFLSSFLKPLLSLRFHREFGSYRIIFANSPLQHRKQESTSYASRQIPYFFRMRGSLGETISLTQLPCLITRGETCAVKPLRCHFSVAVRRVPPAFSTLRFLKILLFISIVKINNQYFLSPTLLLVSILQCQGVDVDG